jgi:hypothetical protein
MFLFLQNNKKSKSWCICVAIEIKTREEEDLKGNELKKETNEKYNDTWQNEINKEVEI